MGPQGPQSPACVLEYQACGAVVERLLQRLRVLMRAMCRREAYEALIAALARCTDVPDAVPTAPMAPMARPSRIEVLYGALYQLTSTSRGARIYRDELTRLRTQSAGAAPP